MPIKVIVNTYPTAFITPGGGEIQLKNTFNAIKSINSIEIDISLYDMWNPNIEKADIVHFFSVYGGSLNFCENVKKLGKKLVFSLGIPNLLYNISNSSSELGNIKSAKNNIFFISSI